MREDTAKEIVSVWGKIVRDEWHDSITEVLLLIPEPQTWAITEGDELALLAEERLYVLGAAVDRDDHLTHIETTVLDLSRPLEKVGLSSRRAYSGTGDRPVQGAHTWTLESAALDRPLEFALGRFEGDSYELWSALTGIEEPPRLAPETPS